MLIAGCLPPVINETRRPGPMAQLLPNPSGARSSSAPTPSMPARRRHVRPTPVNVPPSRDQCAGCGRWPWSAHQGHLGRQRPWRESGAKAAWEPTCGREEPSPAGRRAGWRLPAFIRSAAEGGRSRSARREEPGPRI